MGFKPNSKPLSRKFLIQQGSCCGCECANCPYINKQGKRHIKGTVKLIEKLTKPAIQTDPV